MRKTVNGKIVKIQCNECNHVWEPTNKMLIEHRIENDLSEVYYLCPKCKKRHHVCYKNPECRALQKLISKAKKQHNKEMVDTLSKRLQYEMDKLNNKIIIERK